MGMAVRAEGRMTPQSPAERRKQLLRAGYVPTPVRGKAPFLDEWQKKIETNPGEIDLWSELFPDAKGTGLLTRLAPALDLDILDEQAAEAAEALARERFEEKGHFLVRIGRAPKSAVLFRTNDPFKKISVNLIAPNGDTEQKLEFLGDGQQLVAFGIHPDTGHAYRWHGGEPGTVAYSELPYVHEQEARQLVDDIADLLCKEHG
jgi:Bifunctional DNA primase/polymerase, N-terminal